MPGVKQCNHYFFLNALCPHPSFAMNEGWTPHKGSLTPPPLNANWF